MQLNKVFINWLHARKITDEVIEKFGLHVKDDRLVIPVTDLYGNFIFNKYRRSPLSDEGPKYTYDKGGKLALFGAIDAAEYSIILWTEGELDTLVAWSHNIPAVSGTGGAMSVGEDWKTFFDGKDVIICFDNDPAGGEGMVKALALVPWAKILFLPDRPGVKDISDFVTNGGNLNELIRTAKSFTSIEDVINDRSLRLSLWQSTYFHDAYIKEHTKPAPRVRAPRDERMGDKVTRAKAFPIEEMLEFNHTWKTSCLWHAEKTASLHLYREQNKTWCFGGCGRGYDAIDVYMKLNNVGFKEAVEKLQ